MKFEHVEGRLPIPEDTKIAVLERANGLCEECFHPKQISETFTFHHKWYERWVPGYEGKWQVSVLGKEQPEDLEWLCWDCHKSKHRGPLGEYYLNPEECAAEWEYFHHFMDKD